jgi:hypothetical protein
LFKPAANTVTFAGNGAPTGAAEAGEAASGTAAASSADSPARRAPRDSLVKDQLGKCIAIAPSWRAVSVSLVRPALSCPRMRARAGEVLEIRRIRNVRQVDQAVPLVAALSGIAKSLPMKSPTSGPAMSAGAPQACGIPASISPPGLHTTDVVLAVFGQ